MIVSSYNTLPLAGNCLLLLCALPFGSMVLVIIDFIVLLFIWCCQWHFVTYLFVIYVYTVGHKKRASFILGITLANMDRF